MILFVSKTGLQLTPQLPLKRGERVHTHRHDNDWIWVSYAFSLIVLGFRFGFEGGKNYSRLAPLPCLPTHILTPKSVIIRDERYEALKKKFVYV